MRSRGRASWRTTCGRAIASVLSLLVVACLPVVAAPPAAAAISVDAFVTNNMGKSLANVQGGYQGECVSLVAQFLYQVHDIVPGAWGHAVDYRAGGSGGNQLQQRGFSWSSAQDFQNGDILVWGDGAATTAYGHIAVWYNGRLFQQNYAGRRTAGLDPFFSSAYLGRWRKTPPASGGAIRGSFDAATSPAPGQLRVSGWAFDEDARTTPLDVHVYVGGPAGSAAAQGFSLGQANVLRADVGAAYPGVGNHHGFERVLDVAKFGSQPVYVYAINAPGTPGGNVLLGSRTVVIPQPNPFGSFDELTSPAPGKVRVRGWAADPSSPTASIDVHVYADGTYLTAFPANTSRPDVGAAHSGYGNSHGYDRMLDLAPGAHRVCVYAINTGPGTTNPELGCRNVTVAADTTAPETTITSGPAAAIAGTSVALAFSATEAATFTCRWDGGGWTACTSPLVAAVAPGPHTFEVRARDAAGNVDQTPAARTFTAGVPQTTPGAPPQVALEVTTLKRRSKLRIDIGPDSAERGYAYKVQRRAGSSWRTVKAGTTTGLDEVVVADLRRGRYRVVVPAQHGMQGASQTARLRR